MKRFYENKDKLSNQRKIYYENNRVVLLAKSKVNQQDRKSHTHQLKDFNHKVEELPRTMEMLNFKNRVDIY